MSWLEGWKYRQAIPINGSPDGELTDFQKYLVVKKKVGASSPGEIYLNDHCRDDFGNVRFTKSDGTTELDYWIDDIQAYFANIGFSVALYPNISPVAIYNSSDNKTYVVFQGTSFNPYVTTYNHTTGEWATPVQAGTNPLSNDDHGVPSLIRDAAGYWHAFFGCHATVIKHAKSNNVDDISAWAAQTDISGTAATYPCPVLASNGDIYLFYRQTISSTDSPLYYVKSTDNGASWGSENKIVDFSSVSNCLYHGNYELEVGTPEKIHLAWSFADGDDSWRRNVYHAYLIITGDNAGKLFSMDGTDLGTTITKAEADASCLVYNSGTKNSCFSRVHVYDGIPHIIFPIGEGSTPEGYKHALWNGAAWNSVDIGAISHHPKYGALDFNINGSTSIEAYLITQHTGFTGAGDVEKWIWNGSSWNKSKRVLTAFEYNGLHWPWYVKNAQSDLKLIFTTYYGEVGAFGPTDGFRLYGYGDDGFKTTVDIQALFCIEIDDILEDPEVSNFYIYYGKPSALTSSNGVNTFLMFDHFNDASLDTALWDEGGTGTAVEAQTVLKISAGATTTNHKYITSDSVYPIKVAIEVSVSSPSADNIGINWFGMTTTPGSLDNNNYTNVFRKHGTQDKFRWVSGDEANNSLIDYTINKDRKFHRCSLRRTGTDDILILDGETNVGTEYPTVTDRKVSMNVYNSGAFPGSGTLVVDWVAIRKYTDNEPTWGEPGEEEENPIPGGGTSFVAWIN